MKDQQKKRAELRRKVIDRVHRLKMVLNAKLLLEELAIPTKGKTFDSAADYALSAPFGLDEC